MPLDISFQPMRVLIDGRDSEGNLILADGQLAAVVARLDSEIHALSTRGFGTSRQGSAAASFALFLRSGRQRRQAPGLNKPRRASSRNSAEPLLRKLSSCLDIRALRLGFDLC